MILNLSKLLAFSLFIFSDYGRFSDTGIGVIFRTPAQFTLPSVLLTGLKLVNLYTVSIFLFRSASSSLRSLYLPFFIFNLPADRQSEILLPVILSVL